MSLWVEALGASVRYYDASGVRTRAIEAGDGDALILLHGMGGHAETYIKNVVPLGKHYRTIAIDMLAHGMTAAPPNLAYLVPDYVEHFRALLDALGIEKAHFLGESMGGWFAFWFGLKYPERMRSFISATGSGLGVDGLEVCNLPGVIKMRELSKEIYANPTRELVAARLAWLFHEPEKFVSDELIDTRLHMWSRPEVRAVSGKVLQMLDHDVAKQWYIKDEQLKAFEPPLYFLWTRHNPSIPWQTAKRASEISGGAFDIMEDCGHWPPYENPALFNEKVLGFLDGLKAAR
jgi:2-hydroxy-6-oxonona-2,4-dienedioate hydrolase/2-hydroxy-6-oxo-6-(2'-carboxyphenyl)-hexa-2,4-dienoate hydrolase